MALNTTNTSSANGIVVPDGCLVLQLQEFIPWNNPDNIVSFQTENLLRRLKDLVFLPILFLIGLPANVINMAVFLKQGLKERINVCLFSLSLADGLYLLCNMFWIWEQFYLHFTSNDNYGPVLQWITDHNLLGYFGFVWVSQSISAIIASERCFCILYPLRSHTILRTSTMTAFIVVIFVVVVGGFSLITRRFHMGCAYDPVSDTTTRIMISGEFYFRHQKMLDILETFVYGVGLPGVAIFAVTTTTIMTTIKLRQAAEWRAQTSSRGSGDGGGGRGLSVQEIALTRMLIWNSVLFIICMFPHGLFRIMVLFMPKINAGGRQHNMFWTGRWVLIALTHVNSTFNFIIYYTMGSRYRHTLRLLLCRTKTTESKMANNVD